jgi:hypothetical protein
MKNMKWIFNLSVALHFALSVLIGDVYAQATNVMPVGFTSVALAAC